MEATNEETTNAPPNDLGSRCDASRVIIPLARPPTGGAILPQAIHFQMQSQERLNWCWAAVAVSIWAHYNERRSAARNPLGRVISFIQRLVELFSTRRWTQCKLVGLELDRNNCCGTPLADACDVPWRLGSALKRVGHLDKTLYDSLTPSQIQALIVQAPRASDPCASELSGGAAGAISWCCATTRTRARWPASRSEIPSSALRRTSSRDSRQLIRIPWSGLILI